MTSSSDNTFLEIVASQEVPLAYTSWALSLCGLVSCLLILTVLIKAAFEDRITDNVWKPRTLFEAFSIISTMIGMLVGNYGIFFTYPRIHDMDFRPNAFLAYAYIFQRFLLIGTDLFPSMDRCMAVLYPLKYMTQATPCMAIVIYVMWFLTCVILTVLAWVLAVIPPEMENLPMAPFFFLTSHKFVTMIAIPYLFVLGVVFTCDFIVLVIAICRKHDMTSPKTSLTSATALALSRSSVKESTPRKSVSKDDSQDDAESSSAEILKDLKLSIRCLSLTTCYFVSQLCTFLPGVLLFGCDLKSSSSDVTDDYYKTTMEHCGGILSLEVRIFIFIFYQLQFLKPFFFLTFDDQLWKAVVALFFRCDRDKEFPTPMHV